MYALELFHSVAFTAEKSEYRALYDSGTSITSYTLCSAMGGFGSAVPSVSNLQLYLEGCSAWRPRACHGSPPAKVASAGSKHVWKSSSSHPGCLHIRLVRRQQSPPSQPHAAVFSSGWHVPSPISPHCALSHASVTFKSAERR